MMVRQRAAAAANQLQTRLRLKLLASSQCNEGVGSLQYDDIIFTRVEVGGSFCLLGRLLVQGGGGGGDGHEQGHKHGRQQGPHLIIGLISETTGRDDEHIFSSQFEKVPASNVKR